MSHNRIQNQIAIVGIGSTGYSRNSDRTASSLAAEAAVSAIRDSGLKREDIGGIVASTGPGHWMLVPPGATEMVATLRLPNIVYFTDGNPVIGGSLIEAMNAIYSGICDSVLVYHYNFRTPYNSAKAAADPFRKGFRGYDSLPPDNVRNAAAYAAWASRYLYETGCAKSDFGYVAVNSRTNAIANPLAAMREPMTFDDYAAARIVRDPFNMLDMDLPVDGADAFVLTTVEKARELGRPLVLINSAVQGLIETASDEDQLGSLAAHGQDVVVRQFWERSSRKLADVDIAYIYDGFTFITLSWFEKLGWCKRGEAGDFLRQHWNAEQNRILIDGRIPVNSNGGMLSEGATQGAGFVREAVQQLRGEADERQVANARTALLAIGGFFYNAQAAMLVRE